MSLKLRLARGGTKKRPFYHIVVADARSPRDGRFIEKLGTFNPLLAKDNEGRVVLNTERATHWLQVGAQPTDRVLRFLDAAGLSKREARNNPNKGKPGEKATERAEERAARDAELAAAAAEAAESAGGEGDATPADEAPNEGQSTSEPAEGADDAAPADGAEKAE